jgi:hypothetical protein
MRPAWRSPVGESEFFGTFREGEVSIVDEKQIFSSFGIGVRAPADVDIEPSVSIHVGHSAHDQPCFSATLGFFGDVFKMKITFIQKEPVAHIFPVKRISGKTVIVDAAHGNTAAIVEIDVVGQYSADRLRTKHFGN